MVVPFFGYGTVGDFGVKVHYRKRGVGMVLMKQRRRGKDSFVKKDEYSVFLSKDGYRYDGKAYEYDPGISFRGHLQLRPPGLGTNTK